MKKLTLSAKIWGGFGAVLLLMAVVIGIYQYSSTASVRGFSDLLSEDIVVEISAEEIMVYMLKARRAEKDFLMRRDEKYLDKHAKIIEELVHHANEIIKIEKSTGDEEMEKDARIIIELSEKYCKEFAEVVAAQKKAGLDHKSGLQGEFRASAHRLAELTAQFDVDELVIALLQMRRYEKDYLRTRTDPAKREKYKGKLNKAIANYEECLNGTSCQNIAKREQVEALKRYSAAVQQLYALPEGAPELDEVYQAIRQAAHDSEAAINSVWVSGSKSLVLELRKHEKDYLLRKDKKYVAKAKKVIASLNKAFAEAGIKAEYVSAVQAELQQYSNAFDGLVEAYDEMDVATAAMRETVHQIEPVVEEITEEAMAAGAAKAVSVFEMVATMSKMAISAGALTMLLGFAVAAFLARSIVGPIRRVVNDLNAGSSQVSSASSQVAGAAQGLADGASEQAAAIEETSASMEEISSMTRQNSDNAGQADSLMRETLKVIKEADLSMDEMIVSMGEISKASEETSKIIKTIDEIAFQTNLLALNAAVEAARAGEAGAGFAVVADEVRNLAMRAADAAKETSGMIEETVKKINSGQKIVEKTNEAFGGVGESSTKVASLVGEIATASGEQSQGLNQINEAITQMDNVTQQNAATAEESASASEELNAQALSMMDVVTELRGIVDGVGTASRKSASVNAAPVVKTAALAAPVAVAAAVKTPAAAPKALPKKASPEDIIPMDGDDDFEDF